MSARRPAGAGRGAASSVEDLLELEVGPVAHGGFCVARAGGRVVFVRHALPGERVLARVTDASHDRYWRADAVTILEASPDRVVPPCPHAGPGACGGCDWQHAALPAQRRGKAEVVAEALRRFGGLDARVSPAQDGLDEPAAVPGGPLWVRVEAAAVGGPDDAADDGLAWRTRMRFAVTPEGGIGLRASRSHEVVATPDCRIAHPLVAAALAGRRFPGATAVQVAASPGTGQVAVSVEPSVSGPLAGPDRVDGSAEPAGVAGVAGSAGSAEVVELVGDRSFPVGPGVFWQVHPAAAGLLVETVRAGLRPRPGETALDLYAGAGLFAAFLARDVGASGRVIAVESDAASVAVAADALADLPWISLRTLRVTPATVSRLLGGSAAAGRVGAGGVDIAVLDPPRTGAGPAVMAALLGHRPRAVAYVACDPVALGRDLAAAATAGYDLVSLRAFDLFPMTSHVECVAVLAPRGTERPGGRV